MGRTQIESVWTRKLIRIFQANGDEITKVWRKLSEELHNLYASPNITRMIN
jgi:hypothetical protein